MALLYVVLLLLAGCGAAMGQPESVSTAPPRASSPPPTLTPGLVRSAGELVSPTVLPSVTPRSASPLSPPVSPSRGIVAPYPWRDGNLHLIGTAHLPEWEPLDVPLAGLPRWIMGREPEPGSDAEWVVVLEDGGVQIVAVRDGLARVERWAMPPLLDALPLLRWEGPREELIVPPPGSSAEASSVLLDSGAVVTVEEGSGDLLLREEGETVARLAARALPDARLLRDERGRVLFLSAPTDRYPHAVLGDGIEAGAITLVETTPEFRIANQIEMVPPTVIEGLYPLWTDLDGDGTREILVTESDAARGARLVLWSEAGERLAESDSIGSGFRWRHQLAAAPLGTGGEMEIVDVRTPHIGGVAEWFRWEGTRLRRVAELPGPSSHRIGDRTLATAAVADWDGDGALEVLLPDRTHEQLLALRRTREGAAEVWRLPLGGTLRGNLATARAADGTLLLAAGRADGTIRLWLPPAP